MSNYVAACFVLQLFSSSFSATQSQLLTTFKATSKVNSEGDTIVLQDTMQFLDEIQYLLIITFTSSYIRNCDFCIYDTVSFGGQRMLITLSHEKRRYIVVGKAFDFLYLKYQFNINNKCINRHCKIITNFYCCNIQYVLPCYMNHFSFDVVMWHSHQHAQHHLSKSQGHMMPVHLVSEIIMQSFLIYNADIQLNCVSF